MILECIIVVALVFNLFRTEELIKMKVDVDEIKQILVEDGCFLEDR